MMSIELFSENPMPAAAQPDRIGSLPCLLGHLRKRKRRSPLVEVVERRCAHQIGHSTVQCRSQSLCDSSGCHLPQYRDVDGVERGGDLLEHQLVLPRLDVRTDR